MKKKKEKNQKNAVGGRQNPVEKSDCEKCAEYLGGWKRALADYENLKNDIEKVRSSNRDQIRIDLALSLLPVMDNFDQAVNHAPEISDASIKTWLQGVTFIKKQFEDVLTDIGIEMIDASGEFDLNLHEVVEEREDKDKSPGEIIEVQQTGWKIKDRILRPSKVVINK